jgi:hypothetical protein
MSPDSGSALVFAGRLEAIPLADLLQVIAAGRRGGVLWVQDEVSGAAGEIELHDGRVVGARVSAAAETLGSILVRRRAVAPERVGEALRRQSAAARWKPLGQLLVEMGELEPGALRRGLSEQIAQNTSTIMGWQRGVFRFRVHDGCGARPRPEAHEVALEPHELVLEAARLADEAAAPAGVH